MTTPRITPSSSAEVIPFPETEPPTILERSQPWLDMILGLRGLKPATKVTLTAISRKFNSEYYNQTLELFAWPSRGTLVNATGLVAETIRVSIKEAEGYGVLFVEHGRRRGQRRDVNKYFARMPQGQNSGPWPWPQGQNFDGRDFCLEEKIMDKSRESKRVEKKEGSQGQNFCPSDSDSDSKKESRTPEQAAPQPEAGKAAANRSSSSTGSVAEYLRNRSRSEAAARAAAARAEAAKERDWTPSPHLEASVRKGRR